LGNAEKRKRREKERQKERARKRAEKSAGPSAPNRIFYPYPTPEALIAVGPLILAAWALPQTLIQALSAAGRPIPRPVEGVMLVDTGAMQTCISEVAAQALGLQPVRIAKTYGAAGLHENKVYETQLLIGIGDDKGLLRSDIRFQMQTIGIPQLDEPMKGLKIADREQTLIGLLGRDFLRFTTLTYKGDGSIEIVMQDQAFGGPRSILKS
jgi:hypothetical protein